MTLKPIFQPLHVHLSTEATFRKSYCGTSQQWDRIVFVTQTVMQRTCKCNKHMAVFWKCCKQLPKQEEKWKRVEHASRKTCTLIKSIGRNTHTHTPTLTLGLFLMGGGVFLLSSPTMFCKDRTCFKHQVIKHWRKTHSYLIWYWVMLLCNCLFFLSAIFRSTAVSGDRLILSSRIILRNWTVFRVTGFCVFGSIRRRGRSWGWGTLRRRRRTLPAPKQFRQTPRDVCWWKWLCFLIHCLQTISTRTESNNNKHNWISIHCQLLWQSIFLHKHTQGPSNTTLYQLFLLSLLCELTSGRGSHFAIKATLQTRSYNNQNTYFFFILEDFLLDLRVGSGDCFPSTFLLFVGSLLLAVSSSFSVFLGTNGSLVFGAGSDVFEEPESSVLENRQKQTQGHTLLWQCIFLHKHTRTIQHNLINCFYCHCCMNRLLEEAHILQSKQHEATTIKTLTSSSHLKISC